MAAGAAGFLELADAFLLAQQEIQAVHAADDALGGKTVDIECAGAKTRNRDRG